jgi:hypothetical protein
MDELVRRLAAVECSALEHPKPFVIPNPRAAPGYPAAVSPEPASEEIEKSKAEFAARCPFCIARSVLALKCPQCGGKRGLHGFGCPSVTPPLFGETSSKEAAIEQIAQEVRFVLTSWKPLECSKCGKQAPMVREMSACGASDQEDGITSTVLIEWKPAEDGWVNWSGSGPRGVHCQQCNRKVMEQLA